MALGSGGGRLTATALTVAALTAVGLLLGAAALALGGDRVVGCQSVRGLDALLGDKISHVDGPEGSGGCIVPTAGAWMTAAAATFAPLVAWLLVTRRPEHIEDTHGGVDG